MADWFEQYNADNGTSYQISEQDFPQDSPYGWENYPYDYWNIWVENGNDLYYQEEPTLVALTADYDVIIWKHCFPVSYIEPDTGNPDATSSAKTLENYIKQYNELKIRMLSYPETKFIVWTGEEETRSNLEADHAQRMKQFVTWVKETWDEAGDNIFVWDFYQLETEGGLYLKNAYAESSGDAHPSTNFAQTVASYFGQRIADVIEGRGDANSLTGE